MNRYQLSKPETITNFFERFEEELDDENNNIRMKKTTKPHLSLLLESIIFHRFHNY